MLSFPGSTNQPWHQDGPHIAGSGGNAGSGGTAFGDGSFVAPLHAVNVFVPLIDITSQNGGTEFIAKTHLDYDHREASRTPLVKAGHALIFDYRTKHRGLGNQSSDERPLLYITCASGRASDAAAWPPTPSHALSSSHHRPALPQVLIGGPMVSLGYYVDATAPDPEIVAKNKEEYITLDGIRYFCTGDIGQITPDGNLQIIDRKKDLVKLQQGEYVALSKVENVLKNSLLVEVPMCYGRSDKDYCIALVCPLAKPLADLAATLGVSGDHKALCENAAVVAAATKSIVDTCKAKLVGFEVPKKIGLVAELWTPDNDLLTATMKLKRQPIIKKHQALIDKLYA